MDFKEEIAELIAQITSLSAVDLVNAITIPPDQGLGDYAFPCFKVGKNPKDEAERLKHQLRLPQAFSKMEVAGPYLNFFLNRAFCAEQTLSQIYRERKYYGKDDLGKGKSMVIEYCGPNTNKPLHLGHLRNMALGQAVCRIFSFMGYDVHPVNIINDRGIHICQSMLAYQRWGNGKMPDKKGDHFVGDYYVLFSQKVKEDPLLKEEAQQLLLQWEKEDKEVRELWKRMNSWVLAGFSETYRRFGVVFDKEYPESAYYERAKEVVQEGLEKGIFKKDETGAIIAPLEQHGLPDKVILRADQTSIYMTQDLYLATLRYRDFKFNKMVYVVASEQRLHFQQLFKILEMLGRKYASGLFHLSYGLVHLPSGRMKSREGTIVDADDIIEEIAALAKEEITSRHEHLLLEEVHRRADMIALAAIKFFMLQTDPLRDIVFDPKASLSFEGETGPYLQYTHARACSILRKIKTEQALESSDKVSFEQFHLEEIFRIVKLLYGFSDAVQDVVKSYKPYLLAQYLISLAQAFNEFYHKCPVISERKQEMKARLLLVDCVRQVLDNGLYLLGIDAPEAM